ncbi:MAG: heat-shock protein [Mariprofundaceae bacterium]|nr:heat-shock protein [Mariprofundaceae bacterium]
MTSLLISVLLALLLVLSVLYWQKLEESERPLEPVEDDRIRPLLRGLNYLLSEQPDKALQEIVRVARLRSEATEVYMFLGEMFRNKGEFGRAVRIHQNILARPDVSSTLFIEVQFALATDFQTGGLIDRAVRHYHKVLEVQPSHLGSLKSLLRIHEQTAEWAQAIDLLKRVEQLENKKDNFHHAYLMAEIAEIALQHGDLELALKQAKTSCSLASDCIHAYLVFMHSALQLQDSVSLMQGMDAMAEAAPDFLFLLIPVILPTDHATYETTFLQYWQQYKNAELALAWLEYVAKHDALEAAASLQEKLVFRPDSLRDALRLAALFSDDSGMREHARAWRLQMKHYQCQQCGVQIERLRWQCPQCHAWGSMYAIRMDHEG